MKTFKINEKIEIVCQSESTRNGFRHLAYLVIDGSTVEQTKVCYLNRTWESYEFQTVMQRLVEKSSVLSAEEKQICNDFLKHGNVRDNVVESQFNAVNSMLALGKLFCKDQKEQNDWDKRMISAGLGHLGLSIPADWDSLSEDEKSRRLSLVKEQLALTANSQEATL